jgi:hypothetical protein
MKQPIYDGANEDECEYYDNVIMELPTYEQYIKDMSLVEQIKFYYDVDIDNYLGDPWQIVAEIAEDCPNWLAEFKINFKEYLQEREYIR